MTVAFHQLLAHHVEDLMVRSGLTADTILAHELRSGSAAEVQAVLGFGAGSGLIIPYPGNGFARVKLDRPLGKRKYLSPKDGRNHLFIPRSVTAAQLADVSITPLFTEGEKKCLRAAQDGLVCLGLPGVWGWRTRSAGYTGARGGPIPDLDTIAWAGRTVEIVFDSDLAENEHVQDAELVFALELQGRGATVVRVPMPPGPDGAKQGLDDFLVAHGVEAFRALPRVPIGRKRTKRPPPAPASGGVLPEIDTGNLGLAEMAGAAWRAIGAANDPPRLYRYGNGLAWIVGDAIELMGEAHVRHHLADVATFIRWTAGGPGRPPTKKPAFPPVPLAVDLLTVPDPTLPRLQRLVRTPVFTADGRLLDAPGYDHGSDLYLAPGAFRVPLAPGAPSLEALKAARELLTVELLGDFPFVSDADRAHTLAWLLTPILRETIEGDVPLIVVSKPTPRTGAGLLTKVISLILEGAAPPVTTISRDEEETRKRLTAFLVPGPATVLLDNLHGRLESAALAAILTCGGVWRDRRLGRNDQELVIPVRAVFVVTGNNPKFSNEIAGRSVLIRLDPKMEDPSTRSGFRHPKLEAWTRTRRADLLSACLTLGQAWIAKGRPLADIAFGGFDAWAAVLGGVLTVAGIPGFLTNRDGLYAATDEESAQIKAFLAEWWETFHEQRVQTKELLEIAKRHGIDIEARSDHGMLKRLGSLITSLVDRHYMLDETLTVAIKRDGAWARVAVWRLRQVPRGSLELLDTLRGRSPDRPDTTSPTPTPHAPPCDCRECCPRDDVDTAPLAHHTQEEMEL